MPEVVVCPTADLPPGSRKLVRVGAVEVGVFNVAGAYYALPNICIHQFGPLCEGQISGTVMARAQENFRLTWLKEGEVVVCPWHGLEFDLTTGRCLAFPKVKLRAYKVRVEGEQVLVSS
jgi:nitrite reductase (NADH) small subunit